MACYSHLEKAVDFCFRKGKAVGETKPTERGDCIFEGFPLRVVCRSTFQIFGIHLPFTRHLPAIHNTASLPVRTVTGVSLSRFRLIPASPPLPSTKQPRRLAGLFSLIARRHIIALRLLWVYEPAKIIYSYPGELSASYISFEYSSMHLPVYLMRLQTSRP